MNSFISVTLLSIGIIWMLHFCAGQPISLSTTVYLRQNFSGSICPSEYIIDEERKRIRDSLSIDQYTRPCSCGSPGWTRVAYLNMSDTNQQCPSNWNLTTSPVRGCGRSSTVWTSCDAAIYPVNGRSYSTVCGKIEAYQRGWSWGFLTYTLDRAYVSGVSVTHGPAGNRTHIWSFVGAESESPSTNPSYNCPCTNTNVTWPYQVPSFIRNDYFCDTGNNGLLIANRYYTKDPLWDGQGCGPNSTCCSFNSPPWF